LLRDRSNDVRDQLAWRWLEGESTTFADLGNPQTSADYILCLYGGPSETLLAGGEISTPRSNSKWAAVDGRGWRYRDATTSNGVRWLRLLSGDNQTSMIRLRGKGTALSHPSPPALSAA